MTKLNLWQAIQRLGRPVFTTREIASLTGMSPASATQSLARLEQKELVKKMRRGLWGMVGDRRFSPLLLLNFLSPSQQSYLSFISALHSYGIISQIPQIITVASTTHTQKIHTPVADFSVHQLDPNFFAGFDWHESGQFLIATPEKALIDCLYIGSRRGQRYSTFPEMDFPKNFSKTKARGWIEKIRYPRLRRSVSEKLERIFKK